MKNQELIKKNLFKVKKVTVFTKNYKDEVISSEECIAILVPCFNEYIKSFNDNYVELIKLDGTSENVKVDCISIGNTRITNTEVKEQLNKIVEFAKEDYKFKKETIKFYKELREKEKAIREESSNRVKKMNIMLNDLKKSQGIFSYKDILDNLKVDNISDKEKQWSKRDSNCYTGINSEKEERFGIDIYEDSDGYCTENKKIKVAFSDNRILNISFTHKLYGENYTAKQYDFTFEEYDGTYGICPNLENSKDFNLIKDETFKKIEKSDLDKIKAKETFGASIGNKNSVVCSHKICIDLNLECTKDNLKIIKDRFDSLLELI